MTTNTNLTVSRTTREERVEQARALRAQGYKVRELPDLMGVSIGAIRSYLYDPDRSKEKARKDSYRGRCEDCGAPTDGTNGREAAPKLCLSCLGVRTHEERKWTPETILAAIRLFVEENGRRPSSGEWHRADRDRRFPPPQAVQREFGTWNAAIEAAGCEVNSKPRFPSRAESERRQLVVRRMAAKGKSIQEIACELDLAAASVRYYLDRDGVAA